MTAKDEQTRQLAAEFNAELNAAYGLYLDATMGFAGFKIGDPTDAFGEELGMLDGLSDHVADVQGAVGPVDGVDGAKPRIRGGEELDAWPAQR